VIPALAWGRAGWLGCVILIVAVQLTTLGITLTMWSDVRGPHSEPAPV
jgi:hypothetical protein